MEKLKEHLKNLYKRFNELDKRKKTYSIITFLIVMVMAWAFISAGIITGNFNRSQIQGKEDEQKVDALGVIITETKNSQKYFEIYGETGHYSNDHSVATLYNVIGNFYQNNEVAMSFQSSKGTYDEKTGVIVLYDHTYIVSKDGVSLNTDKLTWSGSDKDTVAEGHVLIKKNDDMKATADKGIICPGYEKFKIIGNSHTEIYKSNGKKNK